MASENETIGDVARALGKIPSGLFILTAQHEGKETGMLASWVMQAGFEPPAVTVAINKERYLLDWLTDGAAFALHVLPTGDFSLVKHFAKGFPPEADPYVGLEVSRDGHGVMLPGVLARLTCRTNGRLSAGDHEIAAAEVVAANAYGDAAPAVHIRKNGLRY